MITTQEGEDISQNISHNLARIHNQNISHNLSRNLASNHIVITVLCIVHLINTILGILNIAKYRESMSISPSNERKRL